MTALLWLRRDLRRTDLPALNAATGNGRVAVAFVLDPRLWDGAGDARRTWLARTLLATRAAYNDRLVLRVGDPEREIPRLAEELGADAVHVSTETTPYGRRRDQRVARALEAAGVGWVETGSPYAVTPGRVLNGSGKPYRVFTPFSRAWQEHGWRRPAEDVTGLHFLSADSDGWDRVERADHDGPNTPAPGEDAAAERWRGFLDEHLEGYRDDRNRPDLDATSRLSPYLKLGVVHPRTLLHALARKRGAGAETLRSELAWREFYADVLFHNPSSAWADLTDALRGIDYSQAGARVEHWREGRTGYPIVDAGMRQLLAEGWMHNRVRMITASFLTKDLHVWWPVGARHFLEHLIDGDLASNNHGWQWVAGTGTDASPYFRVFNPVTQGLRFDPDGEYVRRWVPELQHLAGKGAHEPWKQADGYEHDYPQRIVDHDKERTEALARYQAARS